MLLVFRRLLFYSNRSHYEQNKKQVFTPCNLRSTRKMHRVRARAVRMVLENEDDYSSRWAAITSISANIGCVPQTLSRWVKRREVDSGSRTGVPTDIADKMKALERENRELRQTNEILRKASACFALLSSLAKANDCRAAGRSSTAHSEQSPANRGRFRAEYSTLFVNIRLPIL